MVALSRLEYMNDKPIPGISEDDCSKRQNDKLHSNFFIKRDDQKKKKQCRQLEIRK
jgi:hypothetical protein